MAATSRLVPRLDSWKAAGLALALTLLVPHLPLFLGRVSPIWDAHEFYGPYFMLVGDFARHRELLLWNPFVNAGSPDYIEPQVGTLSPIVLIVGLAAGGSRHGFEIYWLGLWLLGGLGVLALARQLGAPAWGGLVAALGFVFSGFHLGNAEHTSMLATVSFLPATLWRMHVAVTSGSYRAAAEAGALWGLSALAGYPALALLNGCFVFLWAIGAAAAAVRRRLVRVVASHAVMGLVGLAVLAPTYAGLAFEGPGYSRRTGELPRSDAVGSNALHPSGLTTLAAAPLALAETHGETDISMRCMYVGWVVPALAVFGLARRGVGERWWLVLVILVFLSAALGPVLPVRGWLYDWLPPARYFRHAALFRCYVIAGLVILGMLGARDLALGLRDEAANAWRRFAVVSAATATCLLCVYVLARHAALTQQPSWRAPDIHVAAVWTAICGIALATGWLSWPQRSRLVAAGLVIVAVADALATASSMRSVVYADLTRLWSGLAQTHSDRITLTRRGLARVADNGANLTFVSKVPAFRGYGPLPGPLFSRYAADPVLLSSATGADRLWFAPTAPAVVRSEECFDAFAHRAAAAGAPPLVVHAPAVMREPYVPRAGDQRRVPCDASVANLPAASRLEASRVRVTSYTPAFLALVVEAPDRGWLLVTDSWSAGWSATVNGEPAPIWGGNFIFRAVPVKAGSNRIEFRFAPFGFPWLLGLSWATLAAVAAAAVVGAARHRRPVYRSP